MFVCVWLVLGAWGARALAEPYFAVREGYKCSQCHTNITGGGKRNGFGLIYSQTTLPYTIVTLRSLQEVFGGHTPSAPPADLGTFLSAAIGGFLSFGSDFRLENRTVLEEGPVKTRNSFNVTEANLYVEADLPGDFLTLYIDERLGPGGAGSREVFGLLRLLPALNLGFLDTGDVSWGAGPGRKASQQAAMSSSRCRRSHRLLVPGSPSPLRPRKPPKLATVRMH